MEDLQMISTSIVRPSNGNQPDRVKEIHLTPWDLFLLQLCYLQRGRLVKVKNDDDGSVSFSVNCDGGSGVRFVHASAMSVEISDILHYSGFVDGFFSSFFPANGIKNYQGVSNPLLMVQATELKDGIFIGFGYNHTVADGKSIWKFINAWSEICSKEISSHHLVLKGWFLDGIDYPIHVQDPEAKAPSYVTRMTSINLQEKVFHLTKENVSKLKAKANDDAGSSDDSKISSLQAVLAHIWRSIVRNSGVNREEETHCRVPADMRLRLEPPLEEECFGNVSQTGIATTTVGALLDHGLGWAALLINKMVRSQKNETFKAFAENWLKKDKIPIGFGSNSLVVTSSPWFNVYGNDFGWGKPVAARAGPPYLNGRLVVFQGVEEGSLDLQICLPPQVLVNLSKDVEFLEYVHTC
uniref:Putative acetyltransferase n=1 Tax=Noccaea caerulescens TaxID=107243 RepID=A0A1J3JM28_NOCCA